MIKSDMSSAQTAAPGRSTSPIISVIMPNFNGGRLISRSINSVLSQTFRDLELIVVDDGSADDSVVIARESMDSRIQLLQQDHEGVCAARNKGILQARGEYIAFLDSDDTWAPTCLDRLYETIRQAPGAVLAYCGWQNVGLGFKRDKPFIPPDYENHDKLELCLKNTRWPIHAALTKKAAILEAGGFNPRYPTSEDFLLWLTIATRYQIVRLPEVLAYYHHHQGSRATSDPVRMALNHLRAQEEYIHQSPTVLEKLGRTRIRELTFGELVRRGYECYYEGDLVSARHIFRYVMKTGYGSANDWLRMLPSWLPLSLHRRLIQARGWMKAK